MYCKRTTPFIPPSDQKLRKILWLAATQVYVLPTCVCRTAHYVRCVISLWLLKLILSCSLGQVCNNLVTIPTLHIYSYRVNGKNNYGQ